MYYSPGKSNSCIGQNISDPYIVYILYRHVDIGAALNEMRNAARITFRCGAAQGGEAVVPAVVPLILVVHIRARTQEEVQPHGMVLCVVGITNTVDGSTLNGMWALFRYH